MKVLIIDIETTGFLPSGKIVEVGIVELCMDSGSKKIIFDKVINPEISKDEIDKSWIVQNEYMTTEEIMNGVLFESIKEELQSVINDYENGSTAFNSRFDFDFLESYGIKFPKKLPCPMLKSTPICKLPKTGRGAIYGGFKYPKVEEAYKHFFPESEYVELHRGADDAFHEADIVFALHKMNKFIN